MKNIILLISLLICTQISFAQDTIPNLEHPRIGLVLSGGGAKGLAHIGVLKVIDSLGIKVDYIGGTSMGAIIGGLYASGYSGKELEALFNTIDVDALLQDFTPRNSKTFYEKRNDEIYAVTLPFKNFKIGLPSALSKGLYNFNLLSRLTLHVSEINDFSKLPIPFFCIATDVESGEEVILDKGVLSKAMVASGALPTLYNPIEIDGVLLIDGGVVNNYPVEELKRRGADIVIGVDVQDALKSRSQLQDVTSLLGQINNYAMVEKMTKKIQETDIYIKPDIKGYNVISFDKVKELIPKGEVAARELLAKSFVKKYSKEDKNTQKIINLDSIYINKIGVSLLDNYTRSFVIGKLKFKENKTISFKQFEKGINNLNATQNFSSVFYSFQTAENGKNLFLDLKEQKINRFLKFGLHYDGLFKSGVLINFTQKKMFTKNDVFSLDFILGDNFRYNFNYYIDNGFYWSFGISSKYFAFNKNTPTGFNNGSILTNLGVNSINIDYSDLSNQLYLQTIFAQKLSMGAGVELKHLKLKSETLQATNPIFDKSDYLSLFGYMKFDSFDQKNFPKKGGYFNGEIKSFVYSSDYNKVYENFSIAKGDMAIIQTFFKKISVKVQSEGGFTIGERSIDFLDFAIGGFGFANINNIRPFYGYDYIGLVGDSYVKGGVEGDYEFVKKHHLNFTANFANIGDNIFENDTWISKPKYSGYAIGYGMESILGPIEIKHTWSPETKKHYTWFSLGFSF